MRSKRYRAISSKIDKNKIYTIDEALDFIKLNSKAKFNETIELHVVLGIDPRKTEQQVRCSIVLPHGGIKKLRIAAFVNADKVKQAKEAGADIVGGEDLIEKIKESKKCNFDVVIAEPALMKNIAKIAKILGPKGLMPSPKSETITTDIEKTIKEIRKGKINFKNDAGGNLHISIGKVSWKPEKIKDNFDTLITVIKKNKPPKVKGSFLKSIILSSTMGPGLKIQL